MSLIEIIWSPTSRQIRQFGGLCLMALPLLGWLWRANPAAIAVLTAAGGAIAAAAWRKPQLVRPLFVGLILIAAPIGMVVGELALLLIYFTIFLPIGLVFRIVRRDALQLRIDRSAETYWQPKAEPEKAASYYRRY